MNYLLKWRARFSSITCCVVPLPSEIDGYDHDTVEKMRNPRGVRESKKHGVNVEKVGVGKVF